MSAIRCAMRVNLHEDGTVSITASRYDSAGNRESIVALNHETAAHALDTIAMELGLEKPPADPVTEPAPAMPEAPPPPPMPKPKKRSKR